MENDVSPRILNIGAGKTTWIENYLKDTKCNFICDRVDADDCTVNHQFVEKCYRCSAETMSPLDANKYQIAFANWVLEHVSDLYKVSSEIFRVLRPSGIFITTIPNPTSFEILLSKWTPFWFHKIVRGNNAWETHYAYSSVRELIEIFESAGFKVVEIKHFPFIEGYLSLFPFLGILGKLYDKIISYMNIKRLMSNICLTFAKRDDY
ncbi:MAG: hypothetical protein AYP45_06480 [Candidatus Brocadia carolinensis]|uniref:Methyltransferase type 11 domain-containing protein n=1 Tax=Candidatus Brocadia carolinensis TaxID=1004156 RepID=A0A1V4AUT9_9BACT|nr:MAG: hypothetical protein AYP45_06480 [Candidatus Brocadia caroliniensis]